jgi:hypothetical protein
MIYTVEGTYLGKVLMRVIGLNDVIFRHHSGANSADATLLSRSRASW